MNPVSTSPLSALPNIHPFLHRVNDGLKLLLQGLSSLDEQTSRGAIHDLRISTRRLRAALQLSAPFTERKEVKCLKKIVSEATSLLGPVRSLDVSQAYLKSRLQNLPQHLKDSFDFLLREIRKKRKVFRKKLAKALRKHKIIRSLHRLLPLKLSEAAIHPTLTEVLLDESENASRRLLKSWRRFEKKKKILDLHEVRIDLKKWRYLLELQSEYAGSPTPAHLSEIKKVQDRLGDLHDAEVLRDLLKDFKKNRSAKEPKAKKALKILSSELKSDIEKGTESFHREGESILLQLFRERKHA